MFPVNLTLGWAAFAKGGLPLPRVGCLCQGWPAFAKRGLLLPRVGCLCGGLPLRWAAFEVGLVRVLAEGMGSIVLF